MNGQRTRISPRETVVRVLEAVLVRRQNLDEALARHQSGLPNPQDRALVQELAYGVLRWLPRLQAIRDRLLTRPLRARDRDIDLLLLSGLYQLVYTRVPAYAAVAETVAVAGRRGKPWARGLLNGVLRTFQRERETLLASLEQDPAASLAHPSWLLKALRTAWPEAWRELAKANNRRPPMTLRVNQHRGDRETYLSTLQKAGLDARTTDYSPQGLVLAQPVDVGRLPGFDRGLVSVQDEAAQMAAGLLDLAPGMRVLDACAAPGGKTAHILETEPGLEQVLALDKDRHRLARLRENLDRLGLVAEVREGDAGNPDDWWDRRPFQRILLDAPCSATGIIRRHPDIKWRREAAQIPGLTRRQDRLLRALWPLLAPGGTLVYATCSVLPEENEQRIGDFTRGRPGVGVESFTCPWGRRQVYGRQILAGDDDMDGFYYARLKKII